MDDVFLMKLEVTMAELLIKLAPDVYRKFAQRISGKPVVLYVIFK